MAGIYIHIPFCKQACHYCNFHFSTSLRYKNEFVAALLKEIELSVETVNTTPDAIIETIYFGGGTPSLLTHDELVTILQSIRNHFTISLNAEITLEANPDDITKERLEEWKAAGITRLSIGIQSFFDEDLQWMNRAHNAQQAWEQLQLARALFDNITIDLIYGTPGLSDEKWKENVAKAIALGIPHISCYALTVEPQTPLQKLIHQHKKEDVNADAQSAQFLLLMQWLKDAGYEHYEISNFAKPGWRSRHNSSYWSGKNYFGFGPSAHSFDGSKRWWNIANNNTYINTIHEGKLPVEEEILTATQKANEYIMTSLRTMEGLDLEKIKEIKKHLINKSKKYIVSGAMLAKNETLFLTNKGKLLADGIAADLFIDEDSM